MAGLKINAAEIRVRVPECYRGQSYPSKQNNAAQDGSFARKIKEKWLSFTNKEDKAALQPKARMSLAFNKSSFGGVQAPSSKSGEHSLSEPA